MARKEAEIGRVQGKPHLEHVHIKEEHDTIRWSFNEKIEFRIWFPDEWNPLEKGEGESDVSKKGKLERSIRKDVPRGHNSHYPYSIFLIGSKEMVESASPPDMIIE